MAQKPKAAAAKVTLPEKDTREAFEELHAYSSFLVTFTSLWKDLEDHLSSIDRSIEERLRQLESGEQGRHASSPAATLLPSEKDKAAEVEAEVEPRSELKSLCVNMDGRGLLAFIRDNRKDPSDIYKELNAAIRVAPDPAALVLDAMDGFYPAKRSREDTFDGGLHVNRRTCICLLERLHMISPEIKPAVRERAKKLAVEWEVLTTDAGQNLETVAFLQLLVSYGIASDFEENDLLDHLVSIAKKKEAVGLCRNLGLHRRMADLGQKLSSKGKQLDAVKFVFASDLADKSPLVVPLLKSYIKESKRTSQEMRKSGTAKSQNAAIARELDQVRAVIKIIEEYKLESEYSPVILRKRVAQLEQQKSVMRYWVAAKAPYQQKEANKRPRPSTLTTTATAAAVVTAQPPPPPPPLPLPQTQPQFPSTVRAPYMASTGPYDLTGNVVHPYDRTASIYKGNLLDFGGPVQNPAGSLLYSDPRSGSGLYDRSGAYGSYSLSGGFQPQYNSSLYPEL